jgi:outer membrane immunogenic protein
MEKIRTRLLTTAAVVALSSAAYAADMGMPLKAPPPPPPPFSWNGFYLGIAGGAGWGTIENQLNSVTFSDPEGSSTEPFNTPLSQNQINGWLFGGTVGYNWQVNPWLVLGAEGDWDWTDFEGTTPCDIEGEAFGCHDKVSWTADITVRAGFAVDRALLYVKGGAVWAHTNYNVFESSFEDSSPFSASTSDTRLGGLLGMGVEYAFLPNWSAKIEYNFMDFGTKNENLPDCIDGDCVTLNSSVREVIHTVKLGVNYRFNWGQ